MKDIPIIYSRPMILAMLEGWKTMTRRLAWKVEPVWSDGGVISNAAGGQEDYVEPHWVVEGKPSLWQRVKPGDRLWVRENLRMRRDGVWLRAADDSDIEWPAHSLQASAMVAWAHHKEQDYCPSIHMPRWASRLTLIVTATKIERLQDIGDADAEAEGMYYCDEGDAAGFWFASPHGVDGTGVCGQGVVEAFAMLWEHLHGDGAWKENPEVVALTFTVHDQNIDALPKAA